ncbi:hypothetical protein EV06_1205 [Prochlorococcus sp. MIT 0602]|nr:hypothetical protein EV06_1205 [Prochlorococcus sp. MIT 0602]KGG17612.1 hypothetical protein EV07_1052 [Prochlorococcus sp. MIT 0603]
MNCPNWLAQLIKEAGGCVPFSDFMNWSLNHPGSGSYATGRLRIGPSGDFVTSPSLGKDFCELLVKQISDWVEELETKMKTGPKISIVDVGPGEGDLSFHLLNVIKDKYSYLESKIELVLVEINEEMITRQKQKLSDIDFPKIRWTTFEELKMSPIRGIVIANEVLDALPVDRVVWSSKKLYLQGVLLRNKAGKDHLDFTTLPLPSAIKESIDIARNVCNIKIPPDTAEDNWTTEWHTYIAKWFDDVAQFLIEGPLLIIDYALDANRYYKTSRSNGTLVSYSNQMASSDILQNAGICDLTSHICLETTKLFSNKNNWDFVGCRSQGLALLALGLAHELDNLKSYDGARLPLALSKRESLLRLVDPTCLGDFKWLCFKKRNNKISYSNDFLSFRFLSDP